MFLSHLPINVPNYIMGRSSIQFSSLTLQQALSGHNFSINMPNQFGSALSSLASHPATIIDKIVKLFLVNIPICSNVPRRV